jgi:Rrf2 family transcriptional regulator, nitric oxide-sensitive transcriptional repressor
MRLTLWTDCALRVLVYVGAKTDAPSTIAEIAETFRVVVLSDEDRQPSRAARLPRWGPRPGGGIRLGRPASAISAGAVVCDAEEEPAVIGCFGEPGFCRIEGRCVVRRALREATNAFLEVLDGYALADLLAPQKVLDPSTASTCGTGSTQSSWMHAMLAF